MTKNEFESWVNEIGRIYDRLPDGKKDKLVSMTEYFDKAPVEKKRQIADEIIKTARRW